MIKMSWNFDQLDHLVCKWSQVQADAGIDSIAVRHVWAVSASEECSAKVVPFKTSRHVTRSA